jgi:hypothetical protein
MINVFYLLSIIFIWSNIYYIFNRSVLDVRFEFKENTSKTQLFYYYSKLFYWLWLCLGLFTEYYTYFYILGGLSLLKFPLYHLNKKLYVYYIMILPLLNIIFMILLNIKLL